MTDKKTRQVKIHYAETSSTFVSQFIINTSGEDITISCSSGPITDPATGETILPVHTRLSLTMAGARRLHAVLGKVLSQQPGEKERTPSEAQAKIPDIEQ